MVFEILYEINVKEHAILTDMRATKWLLCKTLNSTTTNATFQLSTGDLTRYQILAYLHSVYEIILVS